MGGGTSQCITRVVRAELSVFDDTVDEQKKFYEDLKKECENAGKGGCTKEMLSKVESAHQTWQDKQRNYEILEHSKLKLLGEYSRTLKKYDIAIQCIDALHKIIVLGNNAYDGKLRKQDFQEE